MVVLACLAMAYKFLVLMTSDLVVECIDYFSSFLFMVRNLVMVVNSLTGFASVPSIAKGSSLQGPLWLLVSLPSSLGGLLFPASIRPPCFGSECISLFNIL